MRNFFVLFSFTLLTPLVLISTLILLFSYHRTSVLGATTIRNSPFAFAALPTTDTIFEGSATLNDKRIDNLSQFFTYYHSPLAPYAKTIVSKADEYKIDYRLLPAIAMQETTLCKKTLKDAQYNCWGWGIWGKKVRGFHSYDEAIDTISHYFANKKEKGIESLDAIGNIYNPGNVNHWKENVALVMNQL